MSCSNQSQEIVLDILKKSLPKANQFHIIENCNHEGSENYTSQIMHLTFEFEEEGIRKRKSFVLKQPRNDDTASFFNKYDFFKREKMIYDLILPRMNDFLEESLTPLSLKTTEPNLIILENLITAEYETGGSNRHLCNLNQCLSIFKALAYYHATSHKIAQMDPQLLHNAMLQISTVSAELKKKSIALWQPIYWEILAQNKASHLIPKLQKVFQHMIQNCDEFISKIHHSNFKFHVLSHGDFKKDNVLLKRGPNNMIEGVKLIDLQASFWSTPIYDFTFFFTQSGNAQVVENHYETLVNWYLKCLNEKLEETNCTQRYRKEDFMEDIRSLRIYTILNVTFSSFMVYPADRSELLDSMLKEAKENFGKYMEVCLGDELFVKILLSHLKLFDRLGLFEP